MLHAILDDDHIQWQPPLIRHYTNFWSLLIWTFFMIVQGFHRNICNGCGMPTEDAYASGHLVLSHFGTCKCSNVETNLSWTCLVSWLLNFEHPSVLFFCFECRHWNVWNHFVWLRITDEGSLTEMRILSILLIKSVWKCCIRLFSFSHSADNGFLGFSPWVQRRKIWNFNRFLN